MPSGVSLPPIPAPNEVDARFEQVLKKMDLPLDKARVLRQYDQKKKWELVCDQDKMTEKDPPAAYLAKLQAFMDKKVLKKKRKELGEETSTTVLKHLEISLRTNSIDWVKEFLAAEGLKTLVDYLETVQEAGGLTDSVWDGDDSATPASTSAAPAPAAHSRLAVRSKSSSFPAKLLNPEDDIHVGIQCLRAVMNNKAGFNGVFASERAIYAITRSLLHKSLRTKAQVLELLAAVCLVKGGHDLVMDAFDRFQRLHGELRRFASLFRFFAAPDDFHVDFMVTAMQFINIVVHSVDDMNYRIFLQQEWKRLGLEEVLERLGKQESAELQTQIQAYEENLYDVGALVAESEERTAALAERDAAALQLSRANERLQEQEADYLMQMGQLDRRMQVLLAERDRLAQLHQSNETEVHTLKRLVSEKDRELRSKSSTLEAQIAELERAKAQLSADKRPANPLAHPPAPGPPSAKSAHSPPVPPPRSEHTELSGQSPPPPPPSANPPPPPPPPPSSVPPPPPPPPPPGPPPPPSLKGLNGPPAFDVKTIKRRIQTRYKLPQLNWTPLKPNQLKNTVFDKLDDDKVMEAIDFNQLEELFKLGMKPGSSEEKAGADRTDTAPAKKATENTLLDHKRLRNLAITRRKLGKEPVELMAAVHRFDLESLDLESVELLLRIIPTSEEIQAYKTFETAGKSLDSLSEEDRFFGQLCKIERLSTKLTIMAFMGNFGETAELIQPQLRILMAASSKARDARRFHKVLELVLAYGNYMNSAKRGGAYGFKLQSLETLGFLKSPADKGITLLHLVAGTVEEKFPELAGFGEELVLAEKGSTVGLESVLADLHELERGWAAASKEAGSRDDVPPLLARFLADAKARMDALSEQAKLAQESYRSCLEFYGESGKSLDSAAFFSILHNFARRFAQAQADNVERRKAQQRMESIRAAAEEERRRRVKEARGLGGGSGAGGDGGTLAERQAAVLGEMALVVGGGGGGGDRRKPPDRARRATQKIEQNELNEIGALDQILAYIRETPPQQQANGRAQGPPVPEKRHRPPKPSLHDSRDRPTHAS